MAKTNERTLRLEIALQHLTNQVIACCRALTQVMGRPGCEKLAQDVFARLHDYAVAATAALEGAVAQPIAREPSQQAIPGKRRGRPKKAVTVDAQLDGLPEEEPANAV